MRFDHAAGRTGVLEYKDRPDPAGLSETAKALEEFTAAHAEWCAKQEVRIAHLEQAEMRLNRPRFGPEPTPDEHKRYRGAGDMAPEHKALAQLLRHGDDAELKALSAGTSPDGGYLVSPQLSRRINEKLRDFGVIPDLSRVETIGAGDAFEEPTERGDSSATWVGEAESRTETDTPTFGLLSVPVHEIYALQKVTQRLLDDTGFDIGRWIEDRIANRFGRSLAAACATGDGCKKPKGLLTYPTSTAGDSSRADWTLQHVVSGHATEITADGLRNLYWALRAEYRANAAWVMASATASAIDRLKSGDGDYLWRAGMQAGSPPTLLGRPVMIDENMPSIAASALPIAFGDFQRGYIVVEKPGVKFLRDPYSAKPSVLFYAYRRVGGALQNSDAVKLMQVSA